MNIVIKRIAALAIPVVAGLLAVTHSGFAAESDSYDPLASRISMVRKLIYESSAARQVQNSNNRVAQDKRREAIGFFEQAAAGGELETRKAQLNQAVATMYESVGLVTHSAGGDAGGEEKGQRDYANRKSSLEALLAAHERIMKEKSTPQLHVLLRTEIEEDYDAAESLFAEGRIAEARIRLDRAYETTMLSVEHSRKGETLTRELKFETPEDEYEYELDRNDTHKMLLTVLLEEKLKDERVQKKVAGFIDAADGHRIIAIDQASKGQYEEAIDSLELSTKELVKAIRGAGVYIPG